MRQTRKNMPHLKKWGTLRDKRVFSKNAPYIHLARKVGQTWKSAPNLTDYGTLAKLRNTWKKCATLGKIPLSWGYAQDLGKCSTLGEMHPLGKMRHT